MEKELDQQVKGRKTGSKNKTVKTLEELLNDNEIKGMMLTGFIISNNKLRVTISTEISSTAALLYETILSHRNIRTGKCFPTINVLHKETGISERKISELFGQLSSKGYLIILTGGRHFANEFFFPYEYFFNTFDDKLIYSYRLKTGQDSLSDEELVNQINSKKEYFTSKSSKAYKKILEKLEAVNEEEDPF